MSRVIGAIIAIVHALTQVSAHDIVTLAGGAALGVGLWMYDPRVALVVIGAVLLPLGLSARIRGWLA